MADDNRLPYEVVGNFHVHTVCSDGTGTYEQIAQSAAGAGLDVLMFTDHNTWGDGRPGWYAYPSGERKLLTLVGEEVHDETLSPSVNHFLALGADRPVHSYAPHPQAVIDAVNRHGGAGFIAHPIERPVPVLGGGDTAFPWVDWDVTGFAGIEVWNYMSAFKSMLVTPLVATLAALFPDLFVVAPVAGTLALWDRLLATGRRVVGIGNADAHANVYQIGPVQRCVFPYPYLFAAVNTHLLLDAPLAADWASAQSQVVNALQAGHAFVAYDLAGCARGFRFVAAGRRSAAVMGDEMDFDGSLSLNATVPEPATLRLLRDGRPVAQSDGRELTYRVRQPGVYRLEAYRFLRAARPPRCIQRQAWILSNPIYVRG